MHAWVTYAASRGQPMAQSRATDGAHAIAVQYERLNDKSRARDTICTQAPAPHSSYRIPHSSSTSPS
eukprot:4082608-Pyramimonas_sp.AAC.1